MAELSASELDRRAGLTRGHTSLIEAGAKGDLASSTAAKLASALGLTLDWLICGEGTVPSPEVVRAAVAQAANETAGAA
jgi:transcriptional regulator with XRE-family HTH domain